MLVIPGGAALSGHQTAGVLGRLQSALAECCDECCDVDARFIHFVVLNGELDPPRLKILEQLLGDGRAGNPPDKPPNKDRTKIFTRVVTPRIGTISPWSTKATDLLHHCGLEEVLRVERGVEWRICFRKKPTAVATDLLPPLIHDPMTESVLHERDAAQALFDRTAPMPVAVIDVLGGGIAALEKADAELGLALSEDERRYLAAHFIEVARNPTDVELMMFSQVNSEHCRHKIFNADWTLDGQSSAHSLFDMIRETHRLHGAGTLVAYDDNAAVLAGFEAARLSVDARSRVFCYEREPVHFTIKVETHNHPTAISPFAGAATGAGGEIRDEGATGRGGKPIAGIVGFSVSHLRLPGWRRRWEGEQNQPPRLASPLQIMLDGPLGAAAFNNEFGRPNIAGYFRTFEQVEPGGALRYGYHKPIMLAGGVGTIRPQHVHKAQIPCGAPIFSLGGPAMLIGLGGGAASSVASGSSSESLDYASVQRGNPEMQRRCQEVIDSCCALGEHNPIISIHDVGAGGLCNALPELVHDSARGGEFELRQVLNDEPGMTPMQIWCNESQERYVLAIDPAYLREFEEICGRERCLYAEVGRADAKQNLILRDSHFAARGGPNATPIDLPMKVLFGMPPKMQRDAVSVVAAHSDLHFDGVSLPDAAQLVLSFPSVADKTFLITIGDRSVGGLVARDQMVGPWQVPVADLGVIASGYRAVTGAAIALGERTPLAVIDAVASGRMAVGEAITNIAAARIGDLGNIKLSANWMAAAGEPGHDADLFQTVRAVASELCPKLGISIPVGKDSMSMKSLWRDPDNRECKSVSPLSLIVTAFATVEEVGATLTPQLDIRAGQNDLWLLDLGAGRNRLGGSVLAQGMSQAGGAVADVDDPDLLRRFFDFIQTLIRERHLLAYHDRSDGGALATLCEMAFASRCGLVVDVGDMVGDSLAVLCNEELGAVIQTERARRDVIEEQIHRFDLDAVAHRIGHAEDGNEIVITSGGEELLRMARAELHRIWSETSWRMQTLRDNPECAAQEYARIDDLADPGLFSKLTFDHKHDISAPWVSRHRPKIAILREQGVNGQLEMAAAFECAGFEAVDVTMSDLSTQHSLAAYKGFAACGGFSFGDVLGAGGGWAKSILHNARLRDGFTDFFQREDTFALGVCNGCQMMAEIAELIPGATHWPRFIRNQSEQYEARVAMVEICSDKSILLRGMQGSMFPVSTAHGEGRAEFAATTGLAQLQRKGQVSLRFVDNHGHPTETYPANPNGSPTGATGFTNEDGRFTIMMPHPERVLRSICNSWRPSGDQDWGEYGPWVQIFRNARVWVG